MIYYLQIYFEVLTPWTVNVIFIWKFGLCRCNQVKMYQRRIYWKLEYTLYWMIMKVWYISWTWQWYTILLVSILDFNMNILDLLKSNINDYFYHLLKKSWNVEYFNSIYCPLNLCAIIVVAMSTPNIFWSPKPLNSKCDFIWKLVLCRCNQVKMRSYKIRVGPNPVTGILIKRGIYEHTDEKARWTWR